MHSRSKDAIFSWGIPPGFTLADSLVRNVQHLPSVKVNPRARCLGVHYTKLRPQFKKSQTLGSVVTRFWQDGSRLEMNPWYCVTPWVVWPTWETNSALWKSGLLEHMMCGNWVLEIVSVLACRSFRQWHMLAGRSYPSCQAGNWEKGIPHREKSFSSIGSCYPYVPCGCAYSRETLLEKALTCAVY